MRCFTTPVKEIMSRTREWDFFCHFHETIDLEKKQKKLIKLLHKRQQFDQKIEQLQSVLANSRRRIGKC